VGKKKEGRNVFSLRLSPRGAARKGEPLKRKKKERGEPDSLRGRALSITYEKDRDAHRGKGGGKKPPIREGKGKRKGKGRSLRVMSVNFPSPFLWNRKCGGGKRKKKRKVVGEKRGRGGKRETTHTPGQRLPARWRRIGKGGDSGGGGREGGNSRGCFFYIF